MCCQTCVIKTKDTTTWSRERNGTYMKVPLKLRNYSENPFNENGAMSIISFYNKNSRLLNCNLIHNKACNLREQSARLAFIYAPPSHAAVSTVRPIIVQKRKCWSGQKVLMTPLGRLSCGSKRREVISAHSSKWLVNT